MVLHLLRENRLACSCSQLSTNFNNNTPSPNLANPFPHFRLTRPQRKWTKHCTLTRLKSGNQRKPVKFAVIVIQCDKLPQMIPPHWRTETMADDRGTQSDHVLGNDSGFLSCNDSSNSEMALLSYNGENAVDKGCGSIIRQILILSFEHFGKEGPCELRREQVTSLSGFLSQDINSKLYRTRRRQKRH